MGVDVLGLVSSQVASWTYAFSVLLIHRFQVGKISLAFASCHCELWLTPLQAVISPERWRLFSIREVRLPSMKIYKRTGNNTFLIAKRNWRC